MSKLAVFRRIVVAMLASVALAVSPLSPLQAAAQAPAELQDSPFVIPAPGEAPPVEIPPSEVPEGEFSTSEVSGASKPGEAGAGPTGPKDGLSEKYALTDVSAVDLELTDSTEFSNVYETPQGLTVAELAPLPINAEVDGEWVPIETGLEHSADGSWSTDTHPLDPTFAQFADEEGSFAVSRDDLSISFTLLGAADSEFSTVEKSRVEDAEQPDPTHVVYEDVFEGVDLEYLVAQEGVKEQLVLDALPTPSDATWTWSIDAGEMDLRFNEFGELEFVDEAGAVRFPRADPRDVGFLGRRGRV